MKGAYRDPVDHSRTTQPHAGESFIDTLWLPGLILIMIGTALIAAFVFATAYGDRPLHGLGPHRRSAGDGGRDPDRTRTPPCQARREAVVGRAPRTSHHLPAASWWVQSCVLQRAIRMAIPDDCDGRRDIGQDDVRSRSANPVARTARRSIAARTSSADPTTRTFALARVTAV